MIQKLTEELGGKKWQVEAAVALIDEGNTIPFISRYRKEATGALNDEQLRKLSESALQQIIDKSYDTELKVAGINNIYKYGVAFSGKKVEITVG